MPRALPGTVWLFAFASLLAACDQIDAPTDPVTGAPMLWPEGQDNPISAKSAALTAAGSCGDIDAQLRQMVIREMVARMQASFAASLESRDTCSVWPWGGGDLASARAAPEATDSTSSSTPQHSETNNQVAGVDEADLVKTDGNYLYHVGNGAFRVFRSWPAADTRQLARVPIEGTPKKLFVVGDRALVYSSLDSGSTGDSGSWWRRQTECTYGYDCVPTGDGHPTKITVFDLADRNAPRVARELRSSSSLISARRVGTAVHTVVTAAPTRPQYTIYPDGLEVCDTSRVGIYNAYRALLLANLAMLEAAVLDVQKPTLVDRVHSAAGSVENASPLLDCGSFLRSSLGDGGQMTSLISLAIDDDRPAHAVTIVSKAGVVYASGAAIYLAEPRLRSSWGWFDGLEGASDATTIHKFALNSSNAAASYLASGLIKGRVLNQFALDEQNDLLRIATTSGHAGSSGVHNTVTVLEQRGAALEPVGGIDGIAPGEDIRSVRFDGDRGYVVTFKKTDPLFVLDLADPRAPRVLAELKIPGFSTYMHRMDASHLLTIGLDASDQGSFAWFTGVALQIFDVSDPTQPKLKWKHSIGTRGTASEALTDHLAFTYYAQKNLLALPMTICDGGSQYGGYGDSMTFSGLMVFDVTAAKGFSPRGQMAFTPDASASCSNWWTQASSQVKRSLVIEDYVFALSDTQLKVDSLEKLGAGLVDLPLN